MKRLLVISAVALACIGGTTRQPDALCPRTDADMDARGCPSGVWVLPVDDPDAVIDPCAEIRRRCGL